MHPSKNKIGGWKNRNFVDDPYINMAPHEKVKVPTNCNQVKSGWAF